MRGGMKLFWLALCVAMGLAAPALAGDYAGATAQATVVLGLGANVLVGGSNRTVALQPLSLTGQAGLNLAIGVADLQLYPGR